MKARGGGFTAIDLFAGWGGFTTGSEAAGVPVVYAANHWPIAVDVHQSNHPHITHECQDLKQADWTRLPAYDFLLASPACQGHSRCAQPNPREYHDAMRATAWAVVDCADVTEPKAILIENVLDFLTWRLYPVWRSALEALGYTLSEHRIIAADHGVPQLRERLFIACMKGKRRFVAPEATPGPQPSFGPCIDWEAGDWRPIERASAPARARIATAQRRLGERCLSQHTSDHKGVSVDEPIRTITTKDQWVVVNGSNYRPLLLREYARGMGFADTYSWPDSLARADVVKGLGNAVCPPVATKLVRALAEAA